MRTEFRGGLYKIVVEGYGTYYGESVDIPRRWAKHRKQLMNGRHANWKMRAAFKNSGMSIFTFIVIEQSEELTRNEVLRKVKEGVLIQSDPLCLNIQGAADQPVTATSLPVRDIYRSRVLKIVRIKRGNRVRIYSEEGKYLGQETVNGKFRLGTFYSDENCNLTRRREW